MKEIGLCFRNVITHQALYSLLKDYKRPNDKISEMLKSGELISLKKGLYILGKKELPENFSIANALYGPSYISLESALSFYGLIPERVFATTSVTFKAAKIFDNEVGHFEYDKISLPYYAFGQKYIELKNGQFCMIATPEKALCDKIITEKKLSLRNVKSAREYLIENLRIDELMLEDLNLKEIEKWLSYMPKRQRLESIIKAIKTI